MSKFKNTKTEVDGITFASKKEAARYQELKLMEKAGQISSLVLQPKFEIQLNGIKVCTYIADFCYNDFQKHLSGKSATVAVVEDVKGVRTAVYRLKKKLVKAQYGIEIQEV